MPSRCVGRLLLLARLMFVTLWETFTVRLVSVQSTKILVGWDIFAKLSSDACWSVKIGLWWHFHAVHSIRQLCISLTKSRDAPRDRPGTGIGWFHAFWPLTGHHLVSLPYIWLHPFYACAIHAAAQANIFMHTQSLTCGCSSLLDLKHLL